eukprot:8034101-Pyramimonas_sp.AAC.1
MSDVEIVTVPLPPSGGSAFDSAGGAGARRLPIAGQEGLQRQKVGVARQAAVVYLQPAAALGLDTV